jgi:hypothetical protein
MSTIALTHDVLQRMAERTCASPPTDGLVFFGLRGALPIDLTGTPFAASHPLRITEVDHLHLRCTVGQWRPSEKTLALFPGSTAPHRSAVQQARAAGGVGANMLMLGCYRYARGIHKAGSLKGHRAFRQDMFFPVWRTTDDLDYDLEDHADLGPKLTDYVWDNIHCAHQDDPQQAGFSSNGCQVVAGQIRVSGSDKLELGPWRRFVANGYAAAGQNRYPYLLFAGSEALLAAAPPPQGLARSVRFGSSGEWVEAVQGALKREGFDFLTADGDFGRDTLEAVMAFQRREFGPGKADGVVGPNTAGALGLSWPRVGAVVAAGPAAAAAEAARLPQGWVAAAVKVTCGFEVAGDPYAGVSGDFDGMGVSCGALQWNIGSNSLQPMVRAVGRARVAALMPTLGAEFWIGCQGTRAEGLTAVRKWQKGGKLSKVAETELRALMTSPEMRAEQDRAIEAVAERAYDGAEAWAAAYGLAQPSQREFLWFFDLTTQNGGLKDIGPETVETFMRLNRPDRADDVICDYLAGLSGTSGHVKDAHHNAKLWRGKGDVEQQTLLALSYLRSLKSNPAWAHVVLNRKGTIAMGEGWVNGKSWTVP